MKFDDRETGEIIAGARHHHLADRQTVSVVDRSERLEDDVGNRSRKVHVDMDQDGLARDGVCRAAYVERRAFRRLPGAKKTMSNYFKVHVPVPNATLHRVFQVSGSCNSRTV